MQVWHVETRSFFGQVVAVIAEGLPCYTTAQNLAVGYCIPKCMEHQFPFCFISGASGKQLPGINLPSSLSQGGTAYSSGELSLLPVSKSPA
jgi:hypothetical protein